MVIHGFTTDLKDDIVYSILPSENSENINDFKKWLNFKFRKTDLSKI
jgi:hypothetical protein